MTTPARVPELPARAFRKILVATDFTPGSKRALRKALDLARDLNAEIHLLHVWVVPAARTVFFLSPAKGVAPDLRSRHRTKTQWRLQDFLRGEDVDRVTLRTAFREGRPCAEILDYAEQEGIDLIVVGRRPGRESRLHHLLQHVAFESVGERVRRGALCAVLTVH